MTQLRQAIHRIVQERLGLKHGETVAIVSHEDASRLHDLTWKAAVRLRARPIAIQIPSARRQEHRLPPAVLALLREADAFLVFSSLPFSEKEVASLCSGKCRGLQIASQDAATLTRVLSAGARSVANRSRRLADVFSIGKTLEVLAANGTHLTFSIQRVKARAETGLAHKPNQFSRLPAGSAAVAPVRRSGDGTLITDRLLGRESALARSIQVKLKDGVLTQVKGGVAAQPLRNALRRIGSGQRRVLRLSFGTNHGAELGHSAPEDEVVLGTLHISLGLEAEAEAETPTRSVGLVLSNATLIMDQHPIVDNGRIVV